ncbi:immunoglobulin lambda-1 light chain [Salvelinus sp. IW2-2015]|uniref:immunoglobulin lambda-1 light chain n=1 Tax=Salvelinus sp. IW2-2015 TaxID=2691554 RepID=UPI000CDF6FA2|nr:immunoglobulin lambda-1 light chain [Salvelinus alpinus]
MDCGIIIFSLFLVAASGQRLQQDQILKTRKEKQTVSFSCKVTGSCWGNTVHWYQKGEGEPFSRILYNVINSNSFTRDNTHSQTADFSAVGKSDSSELKIQSVKVSHSATYYCACWDSSTHSYPHSADYFLRREFSLCRLEFGSGTTLYVTDGNTRKPKVTVYPASSSESNGKTTLLCLARDMFPDLVKISWKMEDGITEVPKAEREQLEKREEGQTTSMIIIDKENTYRNKYICSVEHELGAQHFDIPKEDTPTTMSSPTCPFRNDMQEYVEDSFQSTFSLNLASVVYTVMIVKSMVYCCGLSLLLHNRNLGRGPST